MSDRDDAGHWVAYWHGVQDSGATAGGLDLDLNRAPPELCLCKWHPDTQSNVSLEDKVCSLADAFRFKLISSELDKQ